MVFKYVKNDGSPIKILQDYSGMNLSEIQLPQKCTSSSLRMPGGQELFVSILIEK